MPSFVQRIRAGYAGFIQPIPAASPYQEVGVSGTAVYGGYVTQKEKSAVLAGRERWRTAANMLCNISIVAAGTRYFLNLCAKPTWDVETPNDSQQAKDLAEYVEEVLHDMITPWPRVTRRAAMYRFHGFSINEWTAKVRLDGRKGLLDIKPRPQHTITRWNIDEQGNVKGVWQTSPWTGRDIGIPRSKIIYLVDDTLTDSPEGLGWFRHLVEPAQRMEKYLRLEGYGFERELSGIPLGWAPITKINELKKQGKLTAEEATQLIDGIADFVQMQSKKPETGLILDSQPYMSQNAEGQQVSAVKQWGMELLTGEIANLDNVNKAIERLTFEMARIMGIEHLLIGSGDTGSFALSKDKANNLYLLVDSTLGDMSAAMTQDIVDPIWKLNGFPDELKPKLKTEAVAFKDVEQMAATLRDMATAGAILEPDDEAINVMRDLMGLPHQPEMTAERLGMIAERNRMTNPDQQMQESEQEFEADQRDLDREQQDKDRRSRERQFARKPKPNGKANGAATRKAMFLREEEAGPSTITLEDVVGLEEIIQ